MLSQNLFRHKEGNVACIGEEQIGELFVSQLSSIVTQREAHELTISSSVQTQACALLHHAGCQRLQQHIEQDFVGYHLAGSILAKSVIY